MDIFVNIALSGKLINVEIDENSTVDDIIKVCLKHTKYGTLSFVGDVLNKTDNIMSTSICTDATLEFTTPIYKLHDDRVVADDATITIIQLLKHAIKYNLLLKDVLDAWLSSPHPKPNIHDALWIVINTDYAHVHHTLASYPKFHEYFKGMLSTKHMVGCEFNRTGFIKLFDSEEDIYDMIRLYRVYSKGYAALVSHGLIQPTVEQLESMCKIKHCSDETHFILKYVQPSNACLSLSARSNNDIFYTIINRVDPNANNGLAIYEASFQKSCKMLNALEKQPNIDVTVRDNLMLRSACVGTHTTLALRLLKRPEVIKSLRRRKEVALTEIYAIACTRVREELRKLVTNRSPKALKCMVL
jgi:hypothetical protein